MTESVAARHRRLASDFHATIDALPTDAASRPTPCEAWTIGEVIEHVRSTQRDFLLQRGIELPVQTDARTVSAALQAALDDPVVADHAYESFFGPTTLADTVDAFYCLDLVLHRWDIAVAAGLSEHAVIADADIERCRTLVAPAGDALRMPGILGPEVEIADGASSTDRFAAWAGRDPMFSAH